MSRVVTLLALLALTGCGGSSPQSMAKKEAGFDYSERAAAPPDTAPALLPPPGSPAGGNAVAAAGQVAAPPPVAAPVERKIIYSASVEVVVKNLDEATGEVKRLVARHKGYVSRSEGRGNPGSVRTASFTLRVPVDDFAAFKDALIGLGIAERDTMKTDDVTDRYSDEQARVKNLREYEGKLNELLREKRKEEKLEEIDKLMDRIRATREQVDQSEGRLRLMASLAALSTIDVTLKEIADYKPPAPAAAPSFGDRVSRTFENSVASLVEFGQNAALLAVGLAPWLPLLLPLAYLGIWLVRRAVRASAGNGAAVRTARPPEPPPAG